jgi:sugar lactone lactonase YvrE
MVMGKNAMVPGGPGHLKSQVCLELVGLTPFGTVVIMTREGRVLREIDVLGKYPTNLCFGGPDGRTVYVTEAEHTRLVSFRVGRPGLAWRRHRPK